jgi:hypothetical protein
MNSDFVHTVLIQANSDFASPVLYRIVDQIGKCIFEVKRIGENGLWTCAGRIKSMDFSRCQSLELLHELTQKNFGFDLIPFSKPTDPNPSVAVSSSFSTI